MNLDIAKLRYQQQKAQSKGRLDKNGQPIEWLFTFDQWLQLWIDSGKMDQRGCKKGQYVMSRKNDIGPYSADNVEIIQTSENVSMGQNGKGPYKKGSEHKMFGRKQTEETKQKISLSTKGRTPWNKRLTEKEI